MRAREKLPVQILTRDLPIFFASLVGTIFGQDAVQSNQSHCTKCRMDIPDLILRIFEN